MGKSENFRVVRYGALLVAWLIPAMSAAQPAQVSTEAEGEEIVVIEGCLTPGSRPGYFTLTDEVTGDTVTVTGLGELSRHANNHRAQLAGRYVDDDGDEIFQVEDLTHIADSCEPLYERVSQRVVSLARDLRRRAALGVRAGFAMDPELVVIGAHAEFGTGVDGLLFRPNVEFGIGEVTTEYAANAEAVYRVPFTRTVDGRLRVWHVYFGGGPSVSVLTQEFRERDVNQVNPGDFEFDDTDTEIGFNLLMGIEAENGLFGELKAGAYGNPNIRLIMGFTF